MRVERMTGGARCVALGLALTSLLLFGAGSASAATTIGQNGAGGPGATGMGTFVQTATGPGVPSYVVPAGGGVITSWSFLAGSTPNEQDKVKVVRSTTTANEFFVVGEGALETMTPSTLNTFLARIPVQAGDLLGLFTADGNDSVVPTHTTGNTDSFIHSDPPPNTTFTGSPENSNDEAYNVRATVEPDANHDGFGDETQAQADLGIAESATAAAPVGGNITYTLTATDHGPEAAPGVVVSDLRPPGTTFVSASSTQGSCDTTVRCSLGTIASGASVTVTIVVKAASDGFVGNIAAIDSQPLDTAARNYPGRGDTNSANNLAGALTTVGPPGMSGVTQQHRRWRKSRKFNPFRLVASRHVPVGTTFHFTLSRAASVRLVFTQPAPGRKVHGKCVARRSSNRHKHKCTRTVIRGSLHLAGHPGANSVKFYGWLSSHRKLKPGKYTVVITATTPGAGSTSRKLKFTIVR